MTPNSGRPRTDEELDDLLSRPTRADVTAAGALDGDVLVLGAGGKMGPTFARLARRAFDAAGTTRRVIAVSRFTTPGVAERLERDGIEVRRADLLEPGAVRALPDVANVLLMAGHKFGSVHDPAHTWATNVLLPADVARRFGESRIVALSTGNVYPLAPVASGGQVETDPVGPIGEYAQSALARERVLAYLSRRGRTPMTLLRLNYAVEPRYGVLRDIADRVRAGRPVALAMGHVNVIWHRDACSVVLRAFALCAVPPLILNVTGRETLAVRRVAEAFGACFGVTPTFAGTEADTALLSNAARCHDLLGPPEVSADEAIGLVADWVLTGGRSLDRPTHFEEREGKF